MDSRQPSLRSPSRNDGYMICVDIYVFKDEPEYYKEIKLRALRVFVVNKLSYKTVIFSPQSV